MQFESPYFDHVEDALGAANQLVTEDTDSAYDREVVAKFYNGKETMTPAEAEKNGVKSIVNHLFGFSALDQLRQQLFSIMTADDKLWRVNVCLKELRGQPLNSGDRQSLEFNLTDKFNYRVRRSKRLKPEIRSTMDNLVLHGRNPLLFSDRFDWCPRSGFLYVPGDTGTTPETFTYGFSADKLPLWRMKHYLRKAQSASNPSASGWNVKALEEAIDALALSREINSSVLLDGPERENENRPQDASSVGDRRASSQTMPVWYLYEVDQDSPSKPVSLTIIARYTFTGNGTNGTETVTRDKMLYSKRDHFKSVHHWLKPFFIDTQIGGASTWHSVMGLGKLNYARDADVEEFFNMAMDGAKDNVRTKYQAADGASREKMARFFAERGDILPEGLNLVPQQANQNFRNAFEVINILQMLSKGDAGAAYTNNGSQGDELEIQAQERQGRSTALISSRMADVFDMMDEVGLEIFRRFMVGENPESNPGYADVAAFRDDCEVLGITAEIREEICKSKNGLLEYVKVKTSRAAGDGSPTHEMAVADRLVANLGMYSPAAQELIKRRATLVWTRDPDFAAEAVPYERQIDPDQLARARTENTACAERGIVGFVPDLNPDDVSQIHVPEHDNALDALVAKATQEGSMNPFDAAGFKSLASHQMKHVQAMQGDKVLAEAANAAEQKLQEQARQAEGLIKAYETNQANSQLTAKDRLHAAEFAKTQEFKERQQASIEEDRLARREMDNRQQAVDEVEAINNTAAKQAQAAAPIPVSQ